MDYWYKYDRVERFLMEKGLTHEVICPRLAPYIDGTTGMLVIPYKNIFGIMGDHYEKFMEQVVPEQPQRGFSDAVSTL